MPVKGSGIAGLVGVGRRDDPAGYMRAWRANNLEKSRQYHRDYHAAHISNPVYKAMKNEAAKVSRRKQKYGITREDYRGMLTQQDGRCMICTVRLNDELRVDHNHKTGQVRALLCSNCNSGLGLFQEDPVRLNSAVEYLTRYEGK